MFHFAALEATFDNYYDDILSPLPCGGPQPPCRPPTLPSAPAAKVVPTPGPELDIEAVRIGCLAIIDVVGSSAVTASPLQLACILEHHAFFAAAASCPDHHTNDGSGSDAATACMPTADLATATRAQLGPIFGASLGADALGAAVSQLLLSPTGIVRCAAAPEARAISVAFFRLLALLLATRTDRPATPDQTARQFEVTQHSLITLAGARSASR